MQKQALQRLILIGMADELEKVATESGIIGAGAGALGGLGLASLVPERFRLPARLLGAAAGGALGHLGGEEYAEEQEDRDVGRALAARQTMNALDIMAERARLAQQLEAAQAAQNL